MESNGHEDIFWLGWTAGRYPAPSVGTQRFWKQACDYIAAGDQAISSAQAVIEVADVDSHL
jgi:hypothetical protein